ncbi:MAG: hypothetical protein AAB379_01200, partial [Nitrospirota bacterium]
MKILKWEFVIMKIMGKLAVIFSALFLGGMFFLHSSGAEEGVPKLIITKPRTSENYPCSKCHKYLSVNKTKRKLITSHSNITLKHAEE